MTDIKILSPELISAIAAGEVAERPAQIIKELIENSLDARASQIEIRISNSGLDGIVVSDNGEGMSLKNLQLCWQRHTTSKISQVDDLYNLLTFGFRGEALSSIAGVSKLLIQSRTEGAKQGYKIVVKNNDLLEEKPVGTPFGTTIKIDELFSNLPARKKFLGAQKSELRQIMRVVNQLALINFHVSFTFYHNNELICSYNQTKDKADRVRQIMGEMLSSQLLSFKDNLDGIGISGYVGNPQSARKRKPLQFLFVNNRPVKNRLIKNIVKQTYGSLLEQLAQPVFILDLQLNPRDVDVNVHPHKIKVEFSDNSKVKFLIEKAVGEALGKYDLTYHYQTDPVEEQELRDKKTIQHAKKLIKSRVSAFQPKSLAKEQIIQVDNTYLIYPDSNGFAIVDQHAAHERILYEQFKNQFLNTNPEKVKLEKEVLIELPLEDKQLILDSKSKLDGLGFEFATNKRGLVFVAVPLLMKEHKLDELVLELASDESTTKDDSEIDTQTRRVLNFLACRNAVMAGDPLTHEERKNLIDKLNNTQGAYTCPHGRPVKVIVSVSELEKMFLRK